MVSFGHVLVCSLGAVAALGAGSCAAKRAADRDHARPASAPSSDLPSPGPDAPIAGLPSCPAGSEPHVEDKPEGELRSCLTTPAVGARGARSLRHGPHELIGLGGRLLVQGEWRDDKQEGVWRWWHPNGKMQQETLYEANTPVTIVMWDDAGRPMLRRDPKTHTMWYPSGRKRSEMRLGDDGVKEKHIWLETGQLFERERWRDSQLIGWEGWSSNGRELDGESCVDDADCRVVEKNECYRCSPPYEAITRWQAAQRSLHPPESPTCAPEPLACGVQSPRPNAVCQQNRCALAR